MGVGLVQEISFVRDESRVEEGSKSSTIALRVIGGNKKGVSNLRQ
jgi:hypothetical protein